MGNRIDAKVVFSFKGEIHSPSATIDLDRAMAANGHLPDLHLLIARENGIDTYSYLYEVMEATELEFGNATGLAADCLAGGEFDIAGFERLWDERNEPACLAEIARRCMGVEDLDARPELRMALLEAFAAGRGQPAGTGP